MCQVCLSVSCRNNAGQVTSLASKCIMASIYMLVVLVDRATLSCHHVGFEFKHYTRNNHDAFFCHHASVEHKLRSVCAA